METYEGAVEHIVFRNDENGYTVFEFTVDSDGSEITVVGNMAEAFVGERLKVCGTWTQHRAFGEQLKLDSYESLRPESKEDIIRLLGGGWIKGMGPHIAGAIVSRFGADTLGVLENEPHRLVSIKGVSKKKALEFSEQYRARIGVKELLCALGDTGISTNQALRLHAIYGDTALDALRENPYRIIDDIEGMGFIAADKIAMRLGFEEDSPLRLSAGLRCTLLWAQNEGHTNLPRETLERTASEQLNAPLALIEHALDKELLSGGLVTKDIGYDAVFLPYLYRRESESARALLDLQAEAKEPPSIDVGRELARLEMSEGLKLAPMQRAAIEHALQNGVMVITGGPGTGKTTILLMIIKLLQKLGLTVMLAAPTGRAAKRMSEATGYEASTLHRLLEYGRGSSAFQRNRENPLLTDAIIVDEASMIDVTLLGHLLDALLPGTRLIFCGDMDQLPSVGPGNVLRDIIESGCFPVARLDEVFRQGERSMIVRNAHRINAGEEPELVPGSDFVFERYQEQEQALLKLLALAEGAKRKGFDVIRDLQVLAPMKRGALGVWNCNAQLQNTLNPPDASKPERQIGNTIFRVGDKIMQTVNNYQQEWTRETALGEIEQGAGVFNGDLGQITAITGDGFELLFDDDRRASYPFSQAVELDLAYCVSIHKSQGSEFKIVLLPLCDCPPMLATRNLLYTAVTRARRSVVIIGRWNTVLRMVSHADTRKRYSALGRFLEDYSQLDAFI